MEICESTPTATPGLDNRAHGRRPQRSRSRIPDGGPREAATDGLDRCGGAEQGAVPGPGPCGMTSVGSRWEGVAPTAHRRGEWCGHDFQPITKKPTNPGGLYFYEITEEALKIPDDYEG